MYDILITLHSLTRWLVVIFGLLALFSNLSGWLGKKVWTPKHRKINGAFIGSLHLQVVLGLLLYVTSPLMKGIFADFGGAMKSASLRFWAVEHITMMLLAAVVAHVSFVMSKKHELDRKRFQYAAMGFILAMLLILAAIPWPFRDAIARPLLPF